MAGSQRRPDLRFSGLGASGSAGDEPARVFAALDDPELACDGIRRDLCEVLEEPAPAAWRPQVTLCRPQPAPSGLPLFRDWPHLLEAHGQADWGACGVDALVLRARPGSGARGYRDIAAWPLS